MNNNLLRLKIQQRLNKLASNDYDNIECWQIAEAFNKAQREWFRRQVKGLNVKQEGTEQSTNEIDDLQKFIKTQELKGTNKKSFFETEDVPDDYAYYIRVSAIADSDVCKNREMTVYLGEEANTSLLLNDAYRSPSFEWGETFATMQSDKFHIFHKDQFKIIKAYFLYYRRPADIAFDGCINPSTGTTSTNQECEFKDSVTELIIDDTVAILAGDLESFNQYQRNSQNSQKNS